MEETGPLHSWLPNFMRDSKEPGDSADNGKPDETSSLIPRTDNHVGRPEEQESGEIYDLPDDQKSGWQGILQEFKILWKGSIPVILAYTLQNSLQTISVIIVGRGSPEDLATAAFAYMFATCTGWLIALGGTTALDTLCSSAFTGSHDPHELGVLLQRAFIVLGGFYVPVVIIWFFSEPLFKVLGQSDQLSHDSARFLWCLIPGGLGYIYFECMKKYLQAQGLILLGSVLQILTFHRDYETWNIRFADNLTNQRRSQFFACVHIQNGPSRRTNSYRDILLAFIPAPAGVCSLRPGLGVLGRLVSQMPAQHRHIRPPRLSRRHPCGNRMVGLRDRSTSRW